MEYRLKNLSILINEEKNRDWIRLNKALSNQEILEDTIDKPFNFKGEVLIVYPDNNIAFLAKIIGCKSTQPRGYIPKPYVIQDEGVDTIKTTIKYKVKELLSLHEKYHKILTK